MRLEKARLVADELGFEEVGPGRFEATCTDCGARLNFDRHGVVGERPVNSSCAAARVIQGRVQLALRAAIDAAEAGGE
ncbi:MULTISPECIES: hypothetical protein [unclassified Bradyrhizobium]|uniref:hypothetical protein n=1 Tax=unclassified Bradyrhizobium TaxID=2631580 RepID=UPI0029168920|nr:MULTISPECIES: hypothetical protein [unclassified Bradyrhizobium]